MDRRSAVWGKKYQEPGHGLDLLCFIWGEPLSKVILSRGVAERVLGEYGMGYRKAVFGLFTAMKMMACPFPVGSLPGRAKPAGSSPGRRLRAGWVPLQE